MESRSNQQVNGGNNPSESNIKLTLMGIDKKWVRYNGRWVDQSTIPIEKEKSESAQTSFEEMEAGASPWWQFWKA